MVLAAKSCGALHQRVVIKNARVTKLDVVADDSVRSYFCAASDSRRRGNISARINLAHFAFSGDSAGGAPEGRCALISIVMQVIVASAAS